VSRLSPGCPRTAPCQPSNSEELLYLVEATYYVVAANEYENAAHLEPSESNLFD
jgi:hypothetical protein